MGKDFSEISVRRVIEDISHHFATQKDRVPGPAVKFRDSETAWGDTFSQTVEQVSIKEWIIDVLYETGSICGY